MRRKKNYRKTYRRNIYSAGNILSGKRSLGAKYFIVQGKRADENGATAAARNAAVGGVKPAAAPTRTCPLAAST